MGAYLYLVTGPILLLLEIVSKGLVEATNFEDSFGWIGEIDSHKNFCIFECNDSPPRVEIGRLKAYCIDPKPKKYMMYIILVVKKGILGRWASQNICLLILNIERI